MCKISHVNPRKPINRAKFELSKIHQKLKKNLTDLIFGMKVGINQIYHYAKFGMNPLNDVQNFHPKLKNCPRTTRRPDDPTTRQTDRRTPHDGNSHLVRWTKVAKKNPTDPIFGVKVTTVQMYHCAKFEADLMNDVQNFPRKRILFTDGRTDGRTDRRRTFCYHNSHRGASHQGD